MQHNIENSTDKTAVFQIEFCENFIIHYNKSVSV